MKEVIWDLMIVDYVVTRPTKKQLWSRREDSKCIYRLSMKESLIIVTNVITGQREKINLKIIYWSVIWALVMTVNNVVTRLRRRKHLKFIFRQIMKVFVTIVINVVLQPRGKK